MRAIDADELKELFREVIAGIAKKPKMTGALEHMVRASAMTVKMIDDMPTINVNEWISVKDELPDTDDDYLVAWMPNGYGGYRDTNKCFMGICEFEKGKFYPHNLEERWSDGVTIYAWMPLPGLYEVKK